MPDESVSTTEVVEGTTPAGTPVTEIGTEPITPVTTSDSTEFDATKFIDKEGKFQQGWKEALIPQDLWKEKFWENVKDLKGLTSIAGNQYKLVGKKGVIPINDNSTPSEVVEYRRAMGIPAEYKYTQPKDIELLDMSPEAVKGDFAELNKVHLSQKQFDVVMGLYTKKIQMLQQHATEVEKQELDEAERIIREESGSNYDSDLHLANRMIEENTQGWSNEKKTKLLEGINDSSVKPYVMSFLKNIAGKFVEHKIITNAEVGLGAADIEMKIHELMAKPEYMNGNAPGHKLLVAQVQKLFQEKAARSQPRQP